jgi:hypothetical protein
MFQNTNITAVENISTQSNLENHIFSNYRKSKLKIKYVCSLGLSCYSASFLKRNHMKLASFPFDWVLFDLKNVMHAIDDNFNVYLDKQYYIDISGNQCGHKLYNEKMFYHHNPLMNESQYQYFINCINRFRALIQVSEYKLFIISFINNSEDNEMIKQRVIYFNHFFKRHTNNYQLLCLIHRIDNYFHSHSSKYDNIDFVEAYTISYCDGEKCLDINETFRLDKILLDKYSFHLVPIHLT